MKTRFLFICFLFLFDNLQGQNLYFPPAGTSWDTIAPSSLGWCPQRLDSLVDFVGNANSKAFIILKSGKIVIEKYYGTFDKDSLWYWASAGKSLISVLTGIAAQNNLLKISDTTSQYLSNGWTSCPPEKERKITIRHQLSMSSGLDDNVPDDDCTTPACLKYKADAGTRWAYHNAPYRLLHQVLTGVSGQTIGGFTNQKIKNPIGMGSGTWINAVFYSRPRDMARFGLLCLAGGRWNNAIILSDTAYFRQMKNSSTTLNPAYGYLWWLNGKSSYRLPGLQNVFSGPLIPNAPADLYAALGKNDQKIYIVPSLDMVVVRMGNLAGGPSLALSSFDNLLWAKIMRLQCPANIDKSTENQTKVYLYPNPANKILNIRVGTHKFVQATIYSIAGRLLIQSHNPQINVETLKPGTYQIRVVLEDKAINILFCKQ